jgi:uncharacterized Zn finger protein
MTTVVLDHKNYLEKITEVYVFASVDKDGEGIIGHTAHIGGQNVFMPFVCADKARMESLKPMAKQIARDHNKKVKLIRLSVREELEEYGK